MEVTPAGLAFAILVLLAMFLGVSAAVWHSWLAPCLLRRKLAAARTDPEKVIVSPTTAVPDENTCAVDQTPNLDFKDVATPNNSPNIDGPGSIRSALRDDDTLKASFSKLEKSNEEGELVKPKPVYYSDKRMRFSASAPERDLPWWFF